MFKRITTIAIACLGLGFLTTPAQAATVNLTLNCASSVSAQNQYVTGGDVLIYTVSNAISISNFWPSGTSYLLVNGGSTVASGSISSDTTTSLNSLSASNTYTLTVTLPTPIPSSFVTNSMHPNGVSGGKSGTNCQGNSFSNVIYFVNDPSMSAGSSAPTSSSPSQAELAAQAAAKEAAKEAAAIVVARQELVSILKSEKPLTIAQMSAADIRVQSEKALVLVNAEIQKLSEAQKTDLKVIATIVRTANFIDKVSTPTTQVNVTAPELVVEKLLSPDYKYKSSILKAVTSADPATLNSLEKIAAVVKSAQEKIQIRKDRIVALQAKIAAGSLGK